MKYPPLKSPITVSKKKVFLEDCFMSTIEAIPAGNECRGVGIGGAGGGGGGALAPPTFVKGGPGPPPNIYQEYQ